MGKNQPVTAVIVGAGNRAMIYASYAKEHPEELKIVGVVDPDRLRRERAAEIHRLTGDQCFESLEELLRHPRPRRCHHQRHDGRCSCEDDAADAGSGL